MNRFSSRYLFLLAVALLLLLSGCFVHRHHRHAPPRHNRVHKQLPPGQHKKIHGQKSAKPYAPGQYKKKGKR